MSQESKIANLNGDSSVHDLIDEAAEAARATCTLLDMFSARLVEALTVNESRETDLLYQGVRTLSQRQREFLNDKIDALTTWSIEVRYLRHD